jgi:hypothetical protein
MDTWETLKEEAGKLTTLLTDVEKADANISDTRNMDNLIEGLLKAKKGYYNMKVLLQRKKAPKGLIASVQEIEKAIHEAKNEGDYDPEITLKAIELENILQDEDMGTLLKNARLLKFANRYIF